MASVESTHESTRAKGKLCLHPYASILSLGIHFIYIIGFMQGINKKKRRGKKNAATMLTCEYKGWPSHEKKHPRDIETIGADIDPQTFWKKYISQRRPVLIDGHPNDPDWTATHRWTVDYLLEKAGNARVRVEQRRNSSEHFGQGDSSKIDTTFGKALRSMLSGNSNLYLTTQDVDIGPDGHPEVMAPPTSLLASDFPLQPALLGNLVPQQINIWMGCAEKDSNSGLHVDFHDNMYVLMYGKKRFIIFPPSQTANMYCHGTPRHIHPNGRIVFDSQGDAILPDGSDAREVDAWRRRSRAEQELADAEAAVALHEPGARARLDKAEKALDEILESALDDDSLFLEEFDDFEAIENNDGNGKNTIAHLNTAGDPDSFSAIPDIFNVSKYPNFPGIQNAFHVELKAGQSLYLPAGWFHHVTSCGPPQGEKRDGFHLALNYWTHPPDVSDPSIKGFNTPYSSDYWPTLWEGRKRRYAALAAQKEDGDGRKGDDDFKNLKRKKEKTGEDNGETKPAKRKHLDYHHHHHSCQDPGCIHVQDHGEIGGGTGWRPASIEEKAHFLQGVWGYFGHGRRQHLCRFIRLRMRRTGRKP